MTTPTLEEVVDRHIHLGHKDPREIAEAVHRELGDTLIEVAAPYLTDFISELARHRLSSQRRSEVARITPKTIVSREIMLKSIWIPSPDGIRYKPLGEATAEDFEARAAYLDRMVAGIANHAEWCRLMAREIRTQHVTRASELDYVPALPEAITLNGE